MLSYWMRHGCLLAVALATSSGGAFVQLDSAPACAVPMPPPASRALTVFSPVGVGHATLGENGDGTAVLAVGTFLGPTTFLGFARFDGTSYTIDGDLQPGQAGRGVGNGTGQFMLENVFAVDLITRMPVGPLDVRVTLSVTDARNVEAHTSQGVRTQTDSVTGQTRVVREHVIGNQASGNTAGSALIEVDIGSGFHAVGTITSGFGAIAVDSVHEVTQLR